MSAAGRFLLRGVSRARQDSIQAALAEAATAPTPESAERWRAAARWMLVRGLLRGPVLNGAALLLVVTAVGVVNESRSDVANQATLGILILGSAALGFLWRHAWIPALLIGSVVAVEHIAAITLGLAEPEMQLPPGWWGSATLLILLVPAFAAAYGGAGLRRLSGSGSAAR